MTVLLLYVEALPPVEEFLLYLSLKVRDTKDISHIKDLCLEKAGLCHFRNM